MNSNSSPFKFLDAYTKEDANIFFGRDREVTQLYELVEQSDLLLVYGNSGVGKTSLIQAGLSSRMRETDWLPLFVRRQGDITQSVHYALQRTAKTELADGIPLSESVDSLFLDYFKPIYLIFDQFEEVFILGNEEERSVFVTAMAELLQAEVRCKIVLILREEYLAALNEFEGVLTNIFDARLRVEPMSYRNAQQVIIRSCQAFEIALESPEEEMAQLIIENVSGRNTGVQLPYLQVYLDSLYQRAATISESTSVQFTFSMLLEQGKVTDVLDNFVANSIQEIKAHLHSNKREGESSYQVEFIDDLLLALITTEGTKAMMSMEELQSRLPRSVPAERIQEAVSVLQQRRIVREYESPEGFQIGLAHDALALQIENQLSESVQFVRRLKERISNSMSLYKSGQSGWLSKNDLDLVEQYSDRLVLNEGEARFVEESKSTYRREARRLLLRRSIIFLLLLLSILLNLVFWFR